MNGNVHLGLRCEHSLQLLHLLFLLRHSYLLTRLRMGAVAESHPLLGSAATLTTAMAGGSTATKFKSAPLGALSF